MLRTLAFIVADTAYASDVDLAAAIPLGLVAIAALVAFLSVRYIPNTAVGVVEKLWSFDGSVPGGALSASAKLERSSSMSRSLSTSNRRRNCERGRPAARSARTAAVTSSVFGPNVASVDSVP